MATLVGNATASRLLSKSQSEGDLKTLKMPINASKTSPTFTVPRSTLSALVQEIQTQLNDKSYTLPESLVPNLKILVGTITQLPSVANVRPQYAKDSQSEFCGLRDNINILHRNLIVTTNAKGIEDRLKSFIEYTTGLHEQHKGIFNRVELETTHCRRLQKESPLDEMQQKILAEMTSANLGQMNWVFSNKAVDNSQDWQSTLVLHAEIYNVALTQWIISSDNTKKMFSEAVAKADLDFTPLECEHLEKVLIKAEATMAEAKALATEVHNERKRIITKNLKDEKPIDWLRAQQSHKELTSTKKDQNYDHLASIQKAMIDHLKAKKELLQGALKLTPPQEFYRAAMLARRNEFIQKIDTYFADCQNVWETEIAEEMKLDGNKVKDSLNSKEVSLKNVEGLLKEISYMGKMAEDKRYYIKYSFMKIPVMDNFSVAKFFKRLSDNLKSHYQLWTSDYKRKSPFESDFLPVKVIDIEKII